MSHTPSPSPPPPAGGGGVRVHRQPRRARTVLLAWGLPVVIAGAGAVAWWLTGGGVEAAAPTPVAQAAPGPVDAAAPALAPAAPATRATPRTPVPDAVPLAADEDFDLPSLDPDDIASHFRPGEPVPTAGELIQALQDMGIHEGLGAFNPPGTRPLMAGLAVPEDFDLPEGYVRHYQTSDDGEPVEAILMFSPDHDFYDSLGQRIAVPEDRVVPPELAPPGLPLRPVELPPQP